MKRVKVDAFFRAIGAIGVILGILLKFDISWISIVLISAVIGVALLSMVLPERKTIEDKFIDKAIPQFGSSRIFDFDGNGRAKHSIIEEPNQELILRIDLRVFDGKGFAGVCIEKNESALNISDFNNLELDIRTLNPEICFEIKMESEGGSSVVLKSLSDKNWHSLKVPFTEFQDAEFFSLRRITLAVNERYFSSNHRQLILFIRQIQFIDINVNSKDDESKKIY